MLAGAENLHGRDSGFVDFFKDRRSEPVIDEQMRRQYVIHRIINILPRFPPCQVHRRLACQRERGAPAAPPRASIAAFALFDRVPAEQNWRETQAKAEAASRNRTQARRILSILLCAGSAS